MIKVVHVISGLNIGGAEMMLFKLLASMDAQSFESRVVSLTGSGLLGDRIRALGVPVRALGLPRGVAAAAGALGLARWLRDEAPQIVQTWMYHADALGGLAARIGCRGAAVVWNVQTGTLDPEGIRRFTIATARACAVLSRWVPDRIVCCGHAVRRIHRELGYRDSTMEVIPNAIDTAVFRPDPLARASLRRELAATDREVLIGMVARFDPQKDHRTFIEAARLLAAGRPEARFVLCGAGVDEANRTLAGWIDKADLGNRCRVLGLRDDIPRIDAGLDVASLSSPYGEGCPNAIGEAMACEVPCVVTDVGDSGALVGDTGRVVPIRDPAALAGAWRDLVDMGATGRERLGAAARRRIEDHYALRAIVPQYERLYRNLAGHRETARRGPAPAPRGPSRGARS